MQRRAKYLLIAVAAAVVVGLALERPLPAPAAPPPPTPNFSQERSSFPAALPERAGMSTAHGDGFAARSWAPPVAPPQPAVQASTPPAQPPMPYRFVGHLTRDGTKQHFLMKGDVLVPVNEGEILEGTYRVEAIAADEITLLYVPLGLQSRLALVSPVDNPAFAARASAPVANMPYTSPPVASQAPDSPSPGVTTGLRAAQLRGPRTQAGPITQ
jgi:hypothetical protein